MYLRLFDLDSDKVAIIEFSSYVGDLPEDNLGIAQVIRDYSSEKILSDKKSVLNGEKLNVKNLVKSKIETIKKVAENDYEIKDEKCNEFWRKQYSSLERRLNKISEEYDKVLEERNSVVKENAILQDEVSKLKSEIHQMQIALASLARENEELKDKIPSGQVVSMSELKLCQEQKAKLEAQLKAKVIDMSAEDEVSVLREVINCLLEDDWKKAMKILMEFV